MGAFGRNQSDSLLFSEPDVINHRLALRVFVWRALSQFAVIRDVHVVCRGIAAIFNSQVHHKSSRPTVKSMTSGYVGSIGIDRGLLDRLNILFGGLNSPFVLGEKFPALYYRFSQKPGLRHHSIGLIPQSLFLRQHDFGLIFHCLQLALHLFDYLIGSLKTPLHSVPLLTIDIGLNRHESGYQNTQSVDRYESDAFGTLINIESSNENNSSNHEDNDSNNNPQARMRDFLVMMGLYAFIALCLVVFWHGLNLYWNGRKCNTKRGCVLVCVIVGSGTFWKVLLTILLIALPVFGKANRQSGRNRLIFEVVEISKPAGMGIVEYVSVSNVSINKEILRASGIIFARRATRRSYTFHFFFRERTISENADWERFGHKGLVRQDDILSFGRGSRFLVNQRLGLRQEKPIFRVKPHLEGYAGRPGVCLAVVPHCIAYPDVLTGAIYYVIKSINFEIPKENMRSFGVSHSLKLFAGFFGLFLNLPPLHPGKDGVDEKSDGCNNAGDDQDPILSDLRSLKRFSFVVLFALLTLTCASGFVVSLNLAYTEWSWRDLVSAGLLLAAGFLFCWLCIRTLQQKNPYYKIFPHDRKCNTKTLDRE